MNDNSKNSSHMSIFMNLVKAYIFSCFLILLFSYMFSYIFKKTFCKIFFINLMKYFCYITHKCNYLYCKINNNLLEKKTTQANTWYLHKIIVAFTLRRSRWTLAENKKRHIDLNIIILTWRLTSTPVGADITRERPYPPRIRDARPSLWSDRYINSHISTLPR